MKALAIFLSLLSCALSFKLHMNLPERVTRNKYFLGEKSYNTLVKNIEEHKVKNLYFNEKLDSVIAEDVQEHDSSLEDYTETKNTPFITDK